MKVEVKAWKRVPAVRGNCHVLLGKGKDNATKSGIDNFGGKHRDEGAKTVKM